MRERECVESCIAVLRIRIRIDLYNFGSRDPHQSQKTNPNPDQHQRQISGAVDGGSKSRVCRPMVADLHHFGEEQDPGPHQSEKSDPDPDPHQSEKRDLDPHHSVQCTVYRYAEKPLPRQPHLYSAHKRRKTHFPRQKERASAPIV
jgi:hypothetical protein